MSAAAARDVLLQRPDTEHRQAPARPNTDGAFLGARSSPRVIELLVRLGYLAERHTLDRTVIGEAAGRALADSATR